MNIRKATVEDCLYLAENLRAQDIAELSASGYESNLSCLLTGIDSTDDTFVCCDENDIPYIICGTRPTDDPKAGIVWALGTDIVKERRKEFIKLSLDWLDVCHGKYPILMNSVHAKNKEHIKWLKWLGFSFGSPFLNDLGEEFIPFISARIH